VSKQLAFQEGDAMDFPQLLSEAEAAGWLGVPIETVALWAREGKLLAAARTEGGQLLFYRWRVERDGAALAAFAPIQTRHGRGRRTSSPTADELVCGCRLNPAPGRLCRTGSALLAAAALAEGFAATAPEDKLLDRIALPRCTVPAPHRSVRQTADSNSAAGICGSSRAAGRRRSNANPTRGCVMPSKKPKGGGTQFSVIRVGWEDAEMTRPLYRFRCQVCGALFATERYKKLLEDHVRSHDRKTRK
jgi:hypothetical protein